MNEEEKRSEGEGTEAPDLGASIIIPDELKAQLSPDLQAAIEAGAPVVVMPEMIGGKWGVGKTRTFEKGFAIAQKKEVNLEEFNTLKKDFKDLVGVQDHLHGQVKEAARLVKKAEMEWKDMLKKMNTAENKLRKKKEQLREIKRKIKDLHDGAKD